MVADMLALAYRVLTELGAPVISLALLRRRIRGKEDPERFAERLGRPSLPRPAGRLIWCHAASVGEAVSVLMLLEKIKDDYPSSSILITTGTVTSARLMQARLPRGILHQYMPVDRMVYVNRFLNHWKPDLVLWVESELWPNMLASLRARLTPAILLNGRMSDKSFRNWYRMRGWAKDILGTFALCLAQTENDRTRFVALGAKPVRAPGNLKYAAKPLPFGADSLAQLKQATGGRPVWLMASTHHGEDAIAMAAHKTVARQRPGLLTIIVPRHPTRGDAIERLAAEAGLTLARRSRLEDITSATEIYLADTMGELGLFYRLSTIVCLAGSFTWGGHNPIEPAQIGCAIVFGPSMLNFQDIARDFVRQQAALQLQHDNELAFTISRLLDDANERTRLIQTARLLADQKRHVLDQILDDLRPWLQATTGLRVDLSEDKPSQERTLRHALETTEGSNS